MGVQQLFLECSARFLSGSAVPLVCYAMLVVYRIDAVYYIVLELPTLVSIYKTRAKK